MTISEAVQNGIGRLRKPYWNPQAWLELYLLDGRYGPWATLHDVGLPAEGTKVLFVGDSDPDWEGVAEV